MLCLLPVGSGQFAVGIQIMWACCTSLLPIDNNLRIGRNVLFIQTMAIPICKDYHGQLVDSCG